MTMRDTDSWCITSSKEVRVAVVLLLLLFTWRLVTQEKALAEINIDEMYPISKPTHHNK